MKQLCIALILFAGSALAEAPSIYANDGTGKYLGKLSANRYDAESISNPYGEYGSRYATDSVNNPYGRYGSRYSPYSATNPYTTQAPVIIAPRSSTTEPLRVQRPVSNYPYYWNSK